MALSPGKHQLKLADDPMLDPAADAARERAAAAASFRQFELMATLPGEPLYRAPGFIPIEQVVPTLGQGATVRLVRMTRRTDAL